RLAPDLQCAGLVAAFDERPELVDREVVLDTVAQLLGHVAGVVGERLCRLGRLPAAVPLLERLRQIPVVQRCERLDPGGEQLVDEAGVESDALPGSPSRAVRGESTPRHPETP